MSTFQCNFFFAATKVTDDPVVRDQFYDGNLKREKSAVVLRLSPTWFRCTV